MNLGKVLKKYQLGGNLPDTSRGSMVISPEQAIALAKQRGFGQLSQKDQIRIGNNIYANELAKEQRGEAQQRDKAKSNPIEKPTFDYGNAQTDDYGDENEVNPYDKPIKETEPKRVYRDVILDGQRVKKWIGEDGKLYDSENGVVLPKPIEIQGDKYERPLKYKYKGIEYQKIDNQWMWKSNKTGALHIAKNFNDDFIARNKLSPLGQNNVSNSNNADELYNRVVNNPDEMKAFSYAAKHSPNDETIKQVSEMLKTQGIEIPKIKSQKQPKQSKPTTAKKPVNIEIKQNTPVEDVPLNMEVFLNEDKQTSYYNKKEKLEKEEKEYQDKLFAIKLEKQINDYGLETRNKYNIGKAVETLQKAQYYPQTDYRGIPKNIKKHGGILKNYSFGGDLGKFLKGGVMKNYSTGGDIAKGVGAGAYGIGEGLIDNLTFGLTDGITDKGYQALSKVGNNSEQFQKTSNIIRGSGNIVGQVGGAVATGGATTSQAISGGLKGANEIVQNTNMNDKAKQWIGVGTKVGGVAASMAGGGLNGDIANAPQGLQEIMNFSKGLQGTSNMINGSKGTYDELNRTMQFPIGGLMKNYQQGGQITQNILPQNPNDLQAITENTVEYNGNPHTKGGIPLGNGKELEKDETVIKQGAIGNKDPYAISPNLVLDRETAKMVGLSAKYAGMKLSDISRKIEDMKPQKENDPMSVKTNSMNKKFALNRLIKANELLSAQHRQENPIPQEMSDLRMEEMQNGGSLGQGFMEWAASKGLEPDEQNWYEYNKLYSSPSSKDFTPIIDNSLIPSNPQIKLRNQPGSFVNNPISEIKPISPSLKLSMNTSLPTQTALPEQYINPGKSGNFNINGNLDKIGMGLKGASLLANFATIGKKPGQIPAQFNPYATEILNNYRNTIDNQAIKNDITSTLNTGLNTNPSRSWNVQRATNAELTGKAMEAMSKANLQNQELNNRYRTELGNVQNQLGSQNVQAKNMAEVLNAQTEANWRNNLRNAIGNVGNDVADMALKKDYLNKYIAEHMKILNEKGKDYGISFTTTEDYLKAISNPEAALILGKIQNKTATPEEIQKLKDIQAGKAVDYTTKK